jgi:hypothetical protein
LIVVIVRNIASVVRAYIVHNTMGQHIPDTRTPSFGFDSPLDLVSGACNAEEEVFGELPAFIFGLKRYLLPGGERWVVECWGRDK